MNTRDQCPRIKDLPEFEATPMSCPCEQAAHNPQDVPRRFVSMHAKREDEERRPALKKSKVDLIIRA